MKPIGAADSDHNIAFTFPSNIAFLKKYIDYMHTKLRLDQNWPGEMSFHAVVEKQKRKNTWKGLFI